MMILLGCEALKQPSPIITATRTTVPPLLDTPTYSMATRNENDGTTNMNILTYATPVSVRPDRVWTLGLYKETLSYDNFVRERTCILQLLTKEHIPLVKILGGTSGRDVDKAQECELLGFSWGSLSANHDAEEELPNVLPNCAYYLKLTAIGDIVDCGSHCVAICKVDDMLVSDEGSKTDYVSTAILRDLGIITEQGRVAED